MKKFLTVGLLAIVALAFMQQDASAWVNSRFGIGLNWDYQSGGNKAGWGLWRNGQPPGPEAFNSGAFQPRYQGPMAEYPPAPMHYAAPQGPGFDMPMFEPSYAQPMMPYAQPFQFATYPRPVYYYYGR